MSFLLKNLEALKSGAKAKGVAVNWKLIERESKLQTRLSQKIEALRARRNQLAKIQDRSVEGRKLRRELTKLENSLRTAAAFLNQELSFVPNPPLAGVPVGDESKNKVLKVVGKIKTFSFPPQDHLTLGEALGIIDVKRAAKISGSRFYFLQNQAFELEFALIQFVVDLLRREKFKLLVTPQLIKEGPMKAAGYLGRAQDEVYCTQDGLYLIGTAEQSILGYHQNEVLDKLPLRYLGFSTCFRREAGSYGRDVHGIIRTHQFDKLEMFSFTEPASSAREHEYLVALEEKILQRLKLPYRKVLIATGDLGLPAAKKIDLEVYLPSQKRYLETHSCSNCTDWQARRANIRFKGREQVFPHTLNGTAVAIGRMLVVILENYQRKDGSIAMPDVLKPYLTFGAISHA